MNPLPYERVSGGAAPHVVTVLVNWRGAQDTLECLESLLAMDYPNQSIVVVDNGSGDGSSEKMQAWAAGRLAVEPQGPVGKEVLSQRCDKPVPCTVVCGPHWRAGMGEASAGKLYVIEANENLGFAGGMNLGMRFAMERRDVEYIWVLNNDTVVARDCLARMVNRAKEDERIGMCGSRVLYYDEPRVIQSLGGARLSKMLGRSRLIGNGLPASTTARTAGVERQLDHLCGVSMLVTRSFLERVGLMEEDYFLYYEEADWAERAKPLYRLAYADGAVVYHKEGASIGSSRVRSRRSVRSTFFLVRSRLKFTRRFHPWALPFVVGYSLALAARALLDRERAHASAILQAVSGKPQMAGRYVTTS